MAITAERQRTTANTAQADLLLFKAVTVAAYLLMAVTSLGYLALTWSTVVLLGGFVTVLTHKDFWCLMIISLIQAARIFHDLDEQMIPNFVSMLADNVKYLVLDGALESIQLIAGAIWRRPAAMSTWRRVLDFLWMGGVVVPFQSMVCATLYVYWYSAPIACIGLALWRVVQRDYSSRDNSDSSGNLRPALDIFYGFILLQGGFYVLWAIGTGLGDNTPPPVFVRQFRKEFGLPDKSWCHESLGRYINDTDRRCCREPASIRGRRLHDFAIESLDSGSWEDVVSGVRLLDALVRKGEDIRSLLLPSRPRIQKLIDALGWRLAPDGAAMEMREAAARIVAHLAGDIHLAQFPGAIECISSLLSMEAANQSKEQDRDAGGPNELILRGLEIIWGLAFDQHNCRTICSTPGLLPKIMAPLSSANLIHDCIGNKDWANLVEGSFEVLYKLIQAPGETGSDVRQQIYSNKQSMTNLNSIILVHDGDEAPAPVMLKAVAMAILTELILDLSIDVAKETKQNLVNKLLKIFLASGEEGHGRAAGSSNPLQELAGGKLVLLARNSDHTMAALQDNIVGNLTAILDADKTTTYRTIAARILENLCAHCNLDKPWVKETLLPKVLRVILSTERATPRNNVSPPHNDEESQLQNSAQGNDEANNNISSQENGDTDNHGTSSTAEQNKQSDRGNNGQTTAPKYMQEAFLSLAVVIRDKLITTDDFEDAIHLAGLEPGAFVAKMKTIVEQNCQETDQSLRIVKLCGQIVEPMVQRDQYAQHFRNKEFAKSLRAASKIMSNLESCMLFARTDFRSNYTLRPLISDLVNSISSTETMSDTGTATAPEPEIH